MRLLTFCTFLDLATVPTFAQTRTGNVEMNGLKPSLKFEQVVKGFLTSLNDKLKLRATEVEFAPGRSLGDHLHIGAGIRYVQRANSLSRTIPEKNRSRKRETIFMSPATRA